MATQHVEEDLTDGHDEYHHANCDDEHYGQHPALQTMCVMNCQTKERIIPNGPPFELSNECFDGHVMLLVRTPDVDMKKTCHHHISENPARISDYFRDKKRRFEFQFQIRLKKVPVGPLFLGCELEHPIKVGTLTKGLVNLLLAMVRRINPGFHYSWGPDMGGSAKAKAAMARNEFEKTHLSFPVEASMDRIVITKPGEALPELGFELMESNESVKRRRKMGAGSVDWNTEDTYTMCLWSAYVDWIKWRSINVPGVAPFSLSRVTGTQPIYLSVYEINCCTAQEYKKKRPPHQVNHLDIYTRLEFSNADTTVGGLAESVLNRSCYNPRSTTAHPTGDRHHPSSRHLSLVGGITSAVPLSADVARSDGSTVSSYNEDEDDVNIDDSVVDGSVNSDLDNASRLTT